MASGRELDRLRTPSPLPADVLVRLPPQDPSAMRNWLLFTEILQFLRIDCPLNWSFVTVLLICRHWYHVAVSSPRLWTKIARGMTLPLVETYLRRSRRAGLSLDTRAKCPEDFQDALLNMLSPHLDRVTHLKTYGFQPYIKHRMERLSFLTLHDDYCVRHHPSTIIIRGDDFPSLRSLALCDSELSSKASIIDVRSLTSLTLDNLPCDTWDELFTLLRSCSALERLTIDSLDIDSMVIPTNTRIRPTIEFQHLKSFAFLHYGRHASMSFLLAHLALPRIAEIKFDTYLDAPGEEDEDADMHHGILIADIVPKDNTMSPAFSAVQAVCLEICYCSLRVKASTLENPCRAGNTTITFSCNSSDLLNLRSARRQIMSELGTVFPRSLTVLHVRVEGDGYFNLLRHGTRLYSTLDSWENLYCDAFPYLEELHASGPTPDFFIDLLSEIGLSSAHLRKFNEPMPWPMLKRIKFEYTAQEQEALNKSKAVIKDIVTTLCNRQAALEKCLEHLALLFPEEPPNLRTHLGQLRDVTETLVCNVGGHDLVLDDVDSVMQ